MSERIDASRTMGEMLADTPESASGSSPAWLEERRRAAAAEVSARPWPTRKDERWRYTTLSVFENGGFIPPRDGRPALSAQDLGPLLMSTLDSYRLVLVNGRFVAELSNLGELPPTVRVESLAAMLESDPQWLSGALGRLSGAGDSAFAALNTALVRDGAVFHVPAGVRLEKPVELLHVSIEEDEPASLQPRILVVIESGAEATLLERYASLGEHRYFTNSVVEISVHSDARLVHERLQEEGRQAFHLAGLYVGIGERASYRCRTAALGGAWARTELRIRYSGEGGEGVIDGLYLAGDRQLVDFHLDVEHEVPGCSSEQHFRGILDGRGIAVFDGRILVAQDAQKTSAHLQNHNLMLSRNAEVDTKPQLEIYADDVECSHGTSIGQLEANAVFYLRSRGIGEADARKLLCLGFAGEILDRYAVEPVRARAEMIIHERLGQVPAVAAAA